MIDIVNHPPLSLEQVRHWTTRGIKGIRLDYAARPSGICTTEVQVERFIEALTAAAQQVDRRPVKTSTAVQRTRAVQRARDFLRSSGF